MDNNLPVESKPFVLMDRLDDQLIIDEMEGRLPEVLTYHYKDSQNNEVWGLSKHGVDECVSELAKKGEVIRELDCEKVEENNEFATFKARCGRYVINKDGTEILLDTAFGFKRQFKKHPTGTNNIFWPEQGYIKALRNARIRLVPKTIQQAIIEFAKQEGRVKKVKEEKKKEKPAQKEFASAKEKDEFKSVMYDYIANQELEAEVYFPKFYTYLVLGIKVATQSGITKDAIEYVKSNIDEIWIGFKKSKQWRQVKGE